MGFDSKPWETWGIWLRQGRKTPCWVISVSGVRRAEEKRLVNDLGRGEERRVFSLRVHPYRPRPSLRDRPLPGETNSV